MPTTHFRNGKLRVVLAEKPETPVISLIAELAEVLVSTKMATQDDVAQLRFAIYADNQFTDITEQQSNITELNITESTIIAFKYGEKAEFVIDEGE